MSRFSPLINKTIHSISPKNRMQEVLAMQKQDTLTKPKGSLGRLEQLATQIAGIRGEACISLSAIFLLVADHGIAGDSTKAATKVHHNRVGNYPQVVTAQMLQNVLNNGAAINVLANTAGARLVVADLGVIGQTPPYAKASQTIHFYNKKIAQGTKDFTLKKAMSKKEAIRSIEHGIDIFNCEIAAQSFDIIGIGELGIGNSSSAAAITISCAKLDPHLAVGPGSGLNKEGVQRKKDLIIKALDKHIIIPSDPISVLSAIGGFEIGAMTGVILAAAARKIPIVLDGYISTSSAIIADLFSTNIRDYLIASHLSKEPGHAKALQHLGLQPLLDLQLRLGEGTGAALALPICIAANRLLQEMASFKEAGVHNTIT